MAGQPFTSARRRRKVRHSMFEEQHGMCWWDGGRGVCYYPGEPMQLAPHRMPSGTDNPRYASFEHLKERRNKGPNTQENLRLAHKKCNHERPPSELDARPAKPGKVGSLGEALLRAGLKPGGGPGS